MRTITGMWCILDTTQQVMVLTHDRRLNWSTWIPPPHQVTEGERGSDLAAPPGSTAAARSRSRRDDCGASAGRHMRVYAPSSLPKVLGIAPPGPGELMRTDMSLGKVPRGCESRFQYLGRTRSLPSILG